MPHDTSICIQKCTIAFDGKDYLVDFGMKIATGEFYALTGPSGSGKSTILNAILGFYTPSADCRIEVNGLLLNDTTYSFMSVSSPSDLNVLVKADNL